MEKINLLYVIAVLVVLVLNRLYRDIISAHRMVVLALAEISGEKVVP
jgi:hypothetical protein